MLSRLVEKAKSLDFIRGVQVGRERVEISHIQFADDTLFFVKEVDHLRFLVKF